MADFLGPWSVPPACNVTMDCAQLLLAANPSAAVKLGRTYCYASLKSAAESFGGCACEGHSGLGGPTCAEQTSASASSLAVAIISLVIALLVIVRYVPTLVYICVRRAPAPTAANPMPAKKRAFKCNAVGISIVAAWITIDFVVITTACRIVLTQYESDEVLALQQLTERLQLVFLGLGTLNLVAVVVELSISMKAIHNIQRFRYRVIAASMLLFVGACVTYLLASPRASLLMCMTVGTMLILIGFFGPAWVFNQALFGRSSQQVANFAVGAEVKKKTTRWEMHCALISAVCYKPSDLMHLLGYSSSSNRDKSANATGGGGNGTLSRQSDGSMVSGPITPKTPSPRKSGGRKYPPSEYGSVSYKTGGPRRIQSSKDEEHDHSKSVISFFTRALRFGVWLSNSLILFVSGIGLLLANLSRFDTNETYRIHAVGSYLQDVGVAFSVYQILWFLDEGLTRSARQNKQRVAESSKNSKNFSPQNSKLEESKIVAPSKVGESQVSFCTKDGEELVVVPAATLPVNNAVPQW